MCKICPLMLKKICTMYLHVSFMCIFIELAKRNELIVNLIMRVRRICREKKKKFMIRFDTKILTAWIGGKIRKPRLFTMPDTTALTRNDTSPVRLYGKILHLTRRTYFLCTILFYLRKILRTKKISVISEMREFSRKYFLVKKKEKWFLINWNH